MFHYIILFFFQTPIMYMLHLLCFMLYLETFSPYLFLIFYFILFWSPYVGLSVLNCSVCSPLVSLLFPVWKSSSLFLFYCFCSMFCQIMFQLSPSPYFSHSLFFQLLCFFFMVGVLFFSSPFFKVFCFLFLFVFYFFFKW